MGGYIFGGPNNKDYGMLGSILGSPYFGKFQPNPQGPSTQIFWLHAPNTVP